MDLVSSAKWPQPKSIGRPIASEIIVSLAFVGAVGFIWLLCAAMGEAFAHGKAEGYKEASSSIAEWENRLYGKSA